MPESYNTDSMSHIPGESFLREERQRYKQETKELTQSERIAVCTLHGSPGLSPVDAYLTAYPQAEKLTPQRRGRKAAAFFRQPKIARALVRLQRQSERKSVSNRDRIIREYQRIAYAKLSNIVDYSKGEIQLAEFKNLTEDQKSAIKKIKVKTTRKITDDGPVPISQVEIELHDKRAALADMSRIEGMFVDRVDHRISGAGAVYSQEQVLAAILMQANEEEREVLERMAQRLSGRVLPGHEPDAGRAGAEEQSPFNRDGEGEDS